MKSTNEYIEVAKLTKPQGLKGELRAQCLCDSPEVLDNFGELYIGEEKTPTKFILKGTRKGFITLKLDGIDDINEAEVFVNEILYAKRCDFVLPENTWFIRDLIGLKVIDVDTGKEYGKVVEILQNSPKDVYVIKSKNGEQLLFPSIPEVLIETDITGGLIKIRPIAGLFDEN